MLTPAELDRLCVVLVGSRNPLNIGAAARAMSNFGFPRLRLVHPYDVAFREARSAVDAEAILTAAEAFEQLPDAIADCALVVGTTGGAQRDPQEPLHRLETAADVIRTHLRSGSKVALLFGSEKVGLSRHDLNHCQLLLRIPTRAEHPSMNLGQSVAVVLYELIRQTAADSAHIPAPPPGAPESSGAALPEPTRPLATAADRERLIAVLLEALLRSGEPRRGTQASLEENLRRLGGHLPLTAADLHEWLGLFRRILWKLQNPGSRTE